MIGLQDTFIDALTVTEAQGLNWNGTTCVYNPAGLWTRPEMKISVTAVRILVGMSTSVVTILSCKAELLKQ